MIVKMFRGAGAVVDSDSGYAATPRPAASAVRSGRALRRNRSHQSAFRQAGVRSLPFVVGALLGTVVGSACGGGEEADGPLVIRVGHVGFPGSPFDHASRRFEELVEQRFPGRVDIRVFGASQLGEDKEMLEGLRLGTLEMHVPSSVLHSVAPEFGLFDLPFLIRDRAHFERIADGEIGRELARILEEDHGVTLLAFWENGFRVITNSVRPIVTPDDLDGIRLRTPKDPERMRLFETLGASPASMSFGEVFTALRQGVVDGQENPLAQLTAARFHEVQRYLSVSNHVYTPAYPLVRTAWFEGLAPDLRAGLREAAVETGRFAREFLAGEDARLLAGFDGEPEVNQVDRPAFEAAAAPVFDHYRERFGGEWIETARALGRAAPNSGAGEEPDGEPGGDPASEPAPSPQSRER